MVLFFSQIKNLLSTKQHDFAKRIILQYPFLFQKEHISKNYPNLFTQEELNFISTILKEKEKNIINQQISFTPQKIEKTPKNLQYEKLKEKLNNHPLKDELKNFRFKRILKFGMTNRDVKYLQIILNLDEDTKLKDKGLGSFGKETEYFGYFTKQAVIKFQEKIQR